MKNNIRNIFRKFLGLNDLDRMLKDSILRENENIALQLLNSLKPINTYLPVTTWSLNPSLIVHILNDIIVNNRKSIIEFGSGLSTFYIAHLIKKNKLDVKFYSVDSNSDWIETIKRNLKDEKILEQVKMIYSPLTPSDFDFKEHKEWYATKVLDDHLSEDIFDLVIVDGPWGGFKYGRFGAVSYLFPDKLDNNYFIVLDDTHRTEEMEIVESWHALIGGNVTSFNNYTIISNGNKFVSNPLFYYK